jgi:hypothetical protein
MQNIPKDQVKQVPLESLTDVYDRLKDHMKVFGVNIDELNPLKQVKQVKETKETSGSQLTHEIFLQILDKYESFIQTKIEEYLASAKDLLSKKDKEGAGQFIQKKKVYENELKNIPKDQVKQVPLESLPDVYDRLKEHMKIFEINIDELNPLKSSKSSEIEDLGLNENEMEAMEGEEQLMTTEILLKIIDNFELILRQRIEKETNDAKELLKNKDKEG